MITNEMRFVGVSCHRARQHPLWKWYTSQYVVGWALDSINSKTRLSHSRHLLDPDRHGDGGSQYYFTSQYPRKTECLWSAQRIQNNFSKERARLVAPRLLATGSQRTCARDVGRQPLHGRAAVFYKINFLRRHSRMPSAKHESICQDVHNSEFRRAAFRGHGGTPVVSRSSVVAHISSRDDAPAHDDEERWSSATNFRRRRNPNLGSASTTTHSCSAHHQSHGRYDWIVWILRFKNFDTWPLLHGPCPRFFQFPEEKIGAKNPSRSLLQCLSFQLQSSRKLPIDAVSQSSSRAHASFSSGPTNLSRVRTKPILPRHSTSWIQSRLASGPSNP